MAHDQEKDLHEEERALRESWDDIARVLLLVAALACAVWAVCAALRMGVHVVTEALVHTAHAWDGLSGAALLFGVLVLGGFVRGWLLGRPGWSDAAGDGMTVALENYHITCVHDGDDPQPRFHRPAFSLAVRKVVATFLTLGTGASGGLEAPVVSISEALGAGWARVMRSVSEHELRTYQLAAIAAGVCTLLGAPFTSALFATEIAYSDRIIHRKFVYALFAAVTVVLVLWFGAGISPEHVLGMGEQTIAGILAGDPEVSLWWVLVLALVGKMITTGLTLESGGSAGLLVPSMFFGGVSGGAAGRDRPGTGGLWVSLRPTGDSCLRRHLRAHPSLSRVPRPGAVPLTRRRRDGPAALPRPSETPCTQSRSLPLCAPAPSNQTQPFRRS